MPRPPSQTADFNALTRRNPHRSRRALLTHRAPPSGQTSCDERFSHALARRLSYFPAYKKRGNHVAIAWFGQKGSHAANRIGRLWLKLSQHRGQKVLSRHGTSSAQARSNREQHSPRLGTNLGTEDHFYVNYYNIINVLIVFGGGGRGTGVEPSPRRLAW